MDNLISQEKQLEAVDFVSLGMVILDELRFPGKAPLLNVMGGSGAYATLGARLFAGNTRSGAIGCLVLAGNNFPEFVETTLRNWGMTLVLKKDTDRPPTRSLLEYEDTTFGPKKFRYTTEPLKPSMSDLVATPLLASRCFHFLSKPYEVVSQINDLLGLRKQSGVDGRPLIAWEPSPAACSQENLEATLDACSRVDIFSPNHLEITRIFTGEDPKEFRPQDLQTYAQRFWDHGIGHGGQGWVVIRAAEHGCLLASRAAGLVWSHSFYGLGSDTSLVVDPTGAGNAFIGGFAVALGQNLSLAEAAAYGTVAASFALGQIGVPRRESDDVGETWNGISVKERLEQYRNRAGNGSVE